MCLQVDPQEIRGSSVGFLGPGHHVSSVPATGKDQFLFPQENQMHGGSGQAPQGAGAFQTAGSTTQVGSHEITTSNLC